MAKLRVALTISGAVSLGAYEAGVLAALLSGIRPLCTGDDPDIRLDAIGGASAGSMAGLLAARCLTGGFDPVYVLEQAWVVQDSIKKMRAHDSQSPLSMSELRVLAAALMDPQDHTVAEYQSVPVEMVMTLACLRGLEYAIKDGTGGQGIDAVTFLDLSRATIRHEMTAPDFLEPVDASIVDVALASGANEVGFPPKLLDRSGSAAGYLDAGLTLPPSGKPWYTDGGTLDNEPLGHTLDLTDTIDAADSDGDFRRLHLLVHPNPAAAPVGDSWADPGNPPTWVETLIRGANLQRTQSLYDDLRDVVKTNTRIRWMNELIDALVPALDALAASEQDRVRAALATVVGQIDNERSLLPGYQAGKTAAVAPSTTRQWLEVALRRVSGTTAKNPVDVDVISPLVLPEAKTVGVENMLAGEVMFHFGGFLDEDMRKSDFDLGYSCALQWMEDGGWTDHGVDGDDARTALAAARAAFRPEELWRKWGPTSAAKLAERHPMALAGLVGQIGRVVLHDGLHRHKQNH